MELSTSPILALEAEVIMVYPYRTLSGRRSILQAVSLADAKLQFSLVPGTVFCEMPKPDNLDSLYTRIDFPEYVDRMLKQHETFCS
jgi:hypothetical protein